jgi:predicted N-acetyltransferase YhbS
VFHLSCETKEDIWEVEALYDLCFGPGRQALSSYRLREGAEAVRNLCFVVRDSSGILAGAIRYWPIYINKADAVLLGPIAVHPTRQGEGLGSFLIRESLSAAILQGWRRVVLVGDAPYYTRFGFKLLSDVQMPPPINPNRILGLALDLGAWNGVSGKVRGV